MAVARPVEGFLVRASRSTVRVESLIVLALLVGAMSILSPYFLSVSNFLNILLATAVIGVLAIGATFVISSAGLDLSLGEFGFDGYSSAEALSGVSFGSMRGS
jgi:ribose transport system permease protein